MSNSPILPGIKGQWIKISECHPAGFDKIHMLDEAYPQEYTEETVYCSAQVFSKSLYWRPLHSQDLRPVSTPAPQTPPRPKLAMGQVWRRRDGETVTVENAVSDSLYSLAHTFIAKGAQYHPDGKSKASKWLDLVELVSDPSAKPPRKYSKLYPSEDFKQVLAIADDGSGWQLARETRFGKYNLSPLPTLPPK